MDLGLQGRVAVVAAASKGLGRATAQALAEEGVSLVVNSRDPRALEEAAAGMPGDVVTVAADVTDPDVPRRLVETALERFGRCDILVPNAGGPPPARALDVEDEAVLAAVNANLLSSIRMIRAAVPSMRERGWGRICCITSVSVKQPIPTLALSNTARTGLWAWAKTASADLFPDGITLNLACPGGHATERVKELAGARGGGGSGRPLGDPGDFGKAVAFLCSEPARYITGVALQVDGGATLGLL